MWSAHTVRRREEALARESDPSKSAETATPGLDLLGLDADPPTLDALCAFAAGCLADSNAFFPEPPAAEPVPEGDHLVFPSPAPSGDAQNDTVRCRLFESRSTTRAVLIIPHWNSRAANYQSLGTWLARFGLTTVYLSLPYHDERGGGGLVNSGLVSANLGRTIRSCRQAVADARAIVGWLWQRGFRRIGVLGSSIGSSLATIVAAHDRRISALAKVLTASDFGEVVWTGRATRHIRQALEAHWTLEQINAAWSVLSPRSYVRRLSERRIPVLVLSGREDRVFLPHLTERLLRSYREQGVRHESIRYGCGHYTIADFPWNVLTLIRLVLFLRRQL